MKKPWSKIRRGDVLNLGGRDWTVEKIKAGKKKAEVKIRHKSNVVRDTVRLDDKVRIAERSIAHGGTSAPQKPAKAKPPKRMPPEPPKPAHGDPWETQQDRIERKLDDILGAKLVGESTDGAATYYVPPVDASTIAAHLLIFHGGIGESEEETGMLKRHAAEHAAAEAGETTLTMPHWHTEKRPTTGKKKGKK